MKKIIAFTGKKESGKTTASNYLMKRCLEESETPVKVERINMKDPIIEEMREHFPMILGAIAENYTLTIDDLFNEKPPLMRKLMQDYGLMRRKEDPMYWVDKWEEKVRRSNSDVIITDDVRFMNEYDAIGRHGGGVYKIVREGLESTDNHATETEIDYIPCPTITAKDKEELFNKIDQIML